MLQLYRGMIVATLPPLPQGELNARIQQQVFPEVRLALSANLALFPDRDALSYLGAMQIAPAEDVDTPTHLPTMIALQIERLSEFSQCEATLTMAAREAQAHLAPYFRAAFDETSAIHAIKLDHCSPIPLMVPVPQGAGVALARPLRVNDLVLPTTFGMRLLRPIDVAWYTFLVMRVLIPPSEDK
ncbi:MAG TPA: hypothetical protein VMV29_15285 [Ktedonobacterales bacterium]|nr:hypothetical protein [Ktedonobacterales bacterium]